MRNLDAIGNQVNGAPAFVPGDATAPTAKLSLLRGSTIEAVPINWLWPGWLAAGKLHVLAGNAGTGKTTLGLSMGATITRGGMWPDGTDAPRGDIVIWSGEDGIADTLVPRLYANGADLAKVHFVGGIEAGGRKRSFDPSADTPMLAEAIEALPDIKLLIVDPIVAAIAGDSHKNAEVRRGLQPLVDLADRRGFALLGISHFSKATQGRDPLERVTGSLAFGALARIVLATAKPTEEDGSKRLVRSKSNIGPDGGGFDYALSIIPLEGEIEGQRVDWGDQIEGTARALLGEVEADPADAQADGLSPAIAAAVDFLDEELRHGPVATTELKRRAAEAGQHWATVRRAKEEVGVVAAKNGMGGGWSWSLPTPPEGAEGAQASQRCSYPESVSTFGSGEHLRAEADPEREPEPLSEEAFS